MSVGNVVHGSSPQHASAVSRLAGARDEESRLRRVWAGAAGTTAEPEAQSQLSAGRAYVAAREEWLHWIDEGESLAPWQDGVWAPETAAVDRRRPEPNRVGRELRGNAERAGRREAELARAVTDTAKRIRLFERRAPTGRPDPIGSSADRP